MLKSEVAVIHLKNAEILAGTSEIEVKSFPIFSDIAINFLSSLSRKILNSKTARSMPDVMTYAFWARKGNLALLKNNNGYLASRNSLGRGLCFHITPSNVPVNFLFSWSYSLLAGNSNVVRVPTKKFKQTEYLLKLLAELLSADPALLRSNAFVRAPKDSDFSEKMSNVSNLRMIWGGDNTVQTIKGFSTPPNCIDLCFPDRYSFALIDCSSLKSVDEITLKKLISNFYNDSYLVDQNACSSPRAIIWLNYEREQAERFWLALKNEVIQKYELQSSVSVDKFTKYCQDAITMDGLLSSNLETNFLYRVEVNNLSYEEVANCGYFYEYKCASLSELNPILGAKTQTVTYFGFDPTILLHHISENGLLGVNRIVPIGKALEINTYWDGYDLLSSLSRIVYIE